MEVVPTAGREAAADFAGMPQAKGYSNKALAQAMERLLAVRPLGRFVLDRTFSRTSACDWPSACQDVLFRNAFADKDPKRITDERLASKGLGPEKRPSTVWPPIIFIVVSDEVIHSWLFRVL
jgi:hypothetical protein